ncbi:MAG: hypothetical protein WBV82_18920 [Myxococcaceae bacterium]
MAAPVTAPLLAQAFREFYDPSLTRELPERFAATPLWQVGIATLVVCMIAAEVGYRIGRWVRRRAAESEPEAPVRSMVGAAMALLAFLLAFTFNMAAAQHQARRQLALEEANAVRTAWLRATLLPQPQQDQTRALLREYVEARQEADRTLLIGRSVRRAHELRKELWGHVSSAAAADPHSTLVPLVVESLNHVFEVGTRRVGTGLFSRIPQPIWLVLFTLTALALGTEGYLNGLTGSRRALALASVVLSLSLVILLISDLDSPRMGFLRVSHVELEELLREMR